MSLNDASFKIFIIESWLHIVPEWFTSTETFFHSVQSENAKTNIIHIFLVQMLVQITQAKSLQYLKVVYT